MRVKAKIINYYCRKDDNSECLDDCNEEECFFCDKEYIFIDKNYKKCKFFKDIFRRYYLELGNKKYVYDEALYNLGGFADTIIEYVIIDDKLVFGEYLKEKNQN